MRNRQIYHLTFNIWSSEHKAELVRALSSREQMSTAGQHQPTVNILGTWNLKLETTAYTLASFSSFNFSTTRSSTPWNKSS